MRIKIIVFAAILLLCNIAYGQQVNEDDYKKAVDYLNCMTVGVSLKINAENNINPQNQKNHQKYEKDFPCEEIPSEKVSLEKITSYVNETGYTSTKALSTEIEQLKNSLKPEWKADEAARFLYEGAFKDNRVLAKFADDKKKFPVFTAFTEKLKKGIQARLPAGDLTPAPSASVSPTSTVPPPPDSFNFSFWIPLVAFLLLAIGLFLSSYYFSGQLGNANNDIRSLKNKFAAFERKPATASVRTTATSNSSEINELKDEINQLVSRLVSLETKAKENKTTPETATSGWQEQQPKTEPAREVFYLSNPNEDGSFNDKSVHSSYREGASIYKFTKTSLNKAEFQIDERESSIKLALQYPDKSIDPVCEAQNAFNPKAGRIVTVQGGSGKAELDGDRWKVTKKALIRYE